MPSGLTSNAAQEYLAAHGYNEIVEQKESLAKKITKRAISPISIMLFVAALLSLVSGNTFDAFFILVLLVLNLAITVWQEHKADTAIEKLNEHLATSVKVLRDGAWHTIPSRTLAPGDLIELKSGAIVPADARLVGKALGSANEAALTGESLPKEKHAGDPLYSGSFIASGLLQAEVTATGSSTYFGKTIAKVDTSQKKSSLEKDILRISRFLSILSVCAVIVLTGALLSSHASLLEVLRLDLSLVIAGIPISLPTVMTLIIAFGVVALAKKQVVVRRLSSLEELANTDLLLTDKTGTLTENKIEVEEIVRYGIEENQIEEIAALIASHDADEPLNAAVLAHAAKPQQAETVAFTPGDSTRKRSTLSLKRGDSIETISFGAPQVIAGLCTMVDKMKVRFEADVERLAKGGYRTLALARATGSEEKEMEMLGLFALSDTLRADAKEVIQFLADNGIAVAMVTGDNRAIAAEVADKLGLPGSRIVARQELLAGGFDALGADAFRQVRAFAEILPEDKYELVKAAKRFYTVASNGDGVNDLPAVKEASVGFAVKNAVDALKGAADIVLLSDGISVMRDAFIEGRKIFARLYAYSLYRISESFRLIITIAILGFLTGTYPLSPLQLILIALLNDIPIISLAFNRVKIANRPSVLNVREQFSTSLLFGGVGVVNSLLLYFFAIDVLHLPIAMVQTLFFLKLTVSGHLLIYVAHTKERWWRYLPSGAVIGATAATQAIATLLALTGWLMPTAVSWQLVVLVWVWSFFFMQMSEIVKWMREHFTRQPVVLAARAI